MKKVGSIEKQLKNRSQVIEDSFCEHLTEATKEILLNNRSTQLLHTGTDAANTGSLRLV